MKRQNPGADHLTAYRAQKRRRRESGADLFRAYVARRTADLQLSRDRALRLKSRLEGGLPPEAYEAARAELTMLQILEELDPVMQDLVELCDHPCPQDEQLANLRSALRLGRGRSPQDAERMWRRRRSIPLWMKAYCAMEKTCVDRSDRDIAAEIGKEVGVTWRTALRYWEQCTKELPWQAQWVREIRLKIRIARARRQSSARRTGRKK